MTDKSSNPALQTTHERKIEVFESDALESDVREQGVIDIESVGSKLDLFGPV